MNRRGPLIALLALAAFVPLSACSRDSGDPAASAPPPAAVATTPSAAGTPEPSPPEGTPTPIAPPLAGGLTPTPLAGSPPTPGGPTPGGPTSVPAPRTVDGFEVVDEVWQGVVREAGGLRLRSAPRLDPGNVVGSVAEGTPLYVEGRVLNGQEAEPGKGTVWLIVGPAQYLYAPPGYVERVR